MRFLVIAFLGILLAAGCKPQPPQPVNIADLEKVSEVRIYGGMTTVYKHQDRLWVLVNRFDARMTIEWPDHSMSLIGESPRFDTEIRTTIGKDYILLPIADYFSTVNGMKVKPPHPKS